MTPKNPSPNHDPASRRAGGPIGPSKPGSRGRSNLLALSSLAVLAVYSAGYVRTQAAARRFQNDEGRKTRMAPQTVAEPASQATMPPAADPVLVAKLTTPVAPELPKATATVATPALPAPTPTAEPAPTVATTTPPTSVPATPPPTPETPPVATSAPVAVAPTPTPPPAANTPATVAPTPAPAESTVATAKVADTGVNSATESSVLPADIKPSKWKDGKYSGWGSCRHGDIEATVEIRGGRIVSSVVSKCRTVYSCNVIDKVIPQVVVRQSPDIDSVSGSTQSADSYYWAVYSALQDAEIKPSKPAAGK